MALVEVRHLVKHFERGGGFLRAKSVVRAVDDISFSIEAGERPRLWTFPPVPKAPVPLTRPLDMNVF